jgi:predicted amidohydrolase YtcJ
MSTDFFLYNGPIYTLDPAVPRVQAIGIRDGRVVVAGSEGKVQAAIGGRAEPLNLRGRAVIPALTDAHIHFTAYAIRRPIRPAAASSASRNGRPASCSKARSTWCASTSQQRRKPTGSMPSAPG